MKKTHSFKMVFVIVAFILAVGIQITNYSVEWYSPLPAKTKIYDNVVAKLKSRQNAYKITKAFSIIPEVEAATDLNNVNAYAVLDYSNGKIIAQNNVSAKVPIASLTKIMTAVVALDLADPDELFTITDKAAHIIPTKIGVVPGQKMTLRELLHASLLTSANDAAQAIADGVDAKYGEPIFVEAMNEKAKFLKLNNSHFANPQGFDNENNYSSVEDLAVLSHYALQNPLISDIVQKESEFLPANENHKQFDLPNWNGILGVYPGSKGIKIGNTGDALFTTIVLSERSEKKVLAVVLGAKNTLDRDLKATELLDIGFENIANLPPINVTEQQLRTKYAKWKF